MSSRRELLKTFMGAGAGAIWLNAQAANKSRRIDVHHHMLPPFQPNMADRHWTPQVALDAMDKFGTETAMLSLTIAGDLLYDKTEKARTFARRSNEYGAKIVSENRKRFGLLAAIPLPDQDGSVKEIEYAYDTLKADGIGLFTDTGDKWPGDPAFTPVFEELNRRKAVVFFHPTVPNCCHNLVAGIGDGAIEFDFDTTRAITSLLYNGVLSRFPDIRFIVNHSGAAVPVLAGRIKDRIPGASSNTGGKWTPTEGKSDKIPNGAFHELRKLYYECAHATYPAPLAALQAFAPPTQYLFGSDFPIEPYETTVEQLPAAKLSAEVRHAMDRGNAERLFPRLKA